jgi:hypothetical protein
MKQKDLQFHEKVKIALDGRTNQWLVEKTGIHASEISRILTGRVNPTDIQMDKIRTAFPYKVNF